MVAIPLSVGAFLRDPSFTPETILKNMVVEKDVSGATQDEYYRIQRPGLAVHQTPLAGVQVRGVFHQQGLFGSLPLAVIGTKLHKFDGTTSTELGTVNDDGDYVEFAATNFGVAVLSSGVVYFHDQTTMTTVAMPEDELPVSICSINSYIIIACSTGRWYWLVPGETVIDASHFATAESMPDNLVAVRTLLDEIYFFGTDTTEVWQTTGDPDLILERAPGRTWQTGCMASETIQPFNNSLIFMGNDGILYGVSSPFPSRISNVGIETRIRNRIGVPSALSFTYDGHTFYVLYIPGEGSFAYDVLTEQWARFSSQADDTHGWRARVATMMGSIALLGDGDSGKVFMLDSEINTDDGVVFERAISGAIGFSGGRRQNPNISIHCGTSAPLDLRLRWHDGEGQDWGSYRTVTTRTGGQEVRYNRIGAARTPYRVIEISTVSDAQLRISGAKANEGRAN